MQAWTLPLKMTWFTSISTRQSGPATHSHGTDIRGNIKIFYDADN